MKLENCPVCTAQLIEQNGRMICPQCGYYQIVNVTTSYSYHQSGPAQTGFPFGAGTQTGSSQAGTQYRPGGQQQAGPHMGPNPTIYPQRNVTVSAKRSAGGSGSTGFVVGVIALVVICIIAVFTAIISLSSVMKNTAPAPAASEIQDEASVAVQDPSVPQSESFQTLVCQIFDKEFEEITPEDLKRINELDFYYDEDDRKCISCYLDDGTEYHYFLNEDLYMDMADLSCFTGVAYLSLEYGYVDPGDFSGMENLVSIASEMSLAQLADAIPYPQNIESIQIYSSIYASSCDGIENFPNLKYFYADGSSMSDITALSGVPGLEQLSLTECDRVTDFAPLYDLSSLQYLNIESSSLKDIGFVANMPKLCGLSIQGAEELISIEPLAACGENLTNLFLTETWDLHDFHVLESLPNLTQLELFLSYEDTLPSFAGMEQLEYLRLSNADDLSGIATAKGLTYLSLDNCSCEDLSFLSQLQNLTTLELCDMSGYYVSLDPVLELPNLTVLDISDSTAYVDATPLLGIPSLQELYMGGCNIGFQTDAVPYNESLLLLDMSDVSLYPVGDGYGALQDEEEIDISRHTDIFASFPNLQYLYLASGQLDDLSFITEDGLSQLQVLDITDNYVVDLSPLAGLEQLWYVKCTDNPIAETAGLDDILVK